jgi:membrane protein implicated in regulation of membrane protease activity
MKRLAYSIASISAVVMVSPLHPYVTGLILVIVAALTALAVFAIRERTELRDERDYTQELRERVTVDEALLEQLRGPRRTADQVRGEGL